MNAQGMVLRPAAPSDLELLQYWDGLPHVIAASGADDDWNWKEELGRTPAWRELLIARLATGRDIGFIQIIDPELEDSHYWGAIGKGHRAIDIWIGETDCLNQGYGSEMMRQALGRCFATPDVHSVLVDPMAHNTDAIRFYRRHGFCPEGLRRFGRDQCLVCKLSREIWLASPS